MGWAGFYVEYYCSMVLYTFFRHAVRGVYLLALIILVENAKAGWQNIKGISLLLHIYEKMN
jgi:hypothetical protein